jgi:hypothetical protein
MTGYKYEVWEDHTSPHKVMYHAKVIDPYGALIGEVKSTSEESTLRAASVLRRKDNWRWRLSTGMDT